MQSEVYRRIVEKKIGRKLLPGEVVHHIDGNRENNREENLFLCRNQESHISCHIIKNVRPDLYWFIFNQHPEANLGTQ